MMYLNQIKLYNDMFKNHFFCLNRNLEFYSEQNSNNMQDLM